MKENPKFIFSGSVKDQNDLNEIVFWGHDAGEFTYDEIEEIIEILVEGERPRNNLCKSD